MPTADTYFKNKVKSDEFLSVSGTATSTAGAATINKQKGLVTTEALTTAAAATYTFTLTNSLITTSSAVFVSIGKGTATTGEPVVQFVTPAAGSAVILITNNAAAAALNGTIKISFFVVN